VAALVALALARGASPVPAQQPGATPQPVHLIQKGATPSPSPGGNVAPGVTPKPAAGTIQEFDVPVRGGLAEITSGPDGNLWFVAQIGKIGKMTTSGTTTLYDAAASGVLLWSIARGANGNL